jgi:hypothetical protein
MPTLDSSTYAAGSGFSLSSELILRSYVGDYPTACTRWVASFDYNTDTLDAGGSYVVIQNPVTPYDGIFVGFNVASAPFEDLITTYELCGLSEKKLLTGFMTGTAEFYWGGTTLQADIFEASVTKNGVTTVLRFPDATMTIQDGCHVNVCACVPPCQQNTILNGVTYDCLPPELTVSLSVIRNETYFPDQNGDTTYGAALTQAVLAEINDLPNMTVPLVSWNGNAATYQYDYPLESNGTKMRYEVTIYCSTVCQPTNSLNTACVKVFLVNTSTATPTPSPAWTVDAFTTTSGSFSKTVSEVNFWYTGNYITDFLDDFGPPSPILTINYTCGNVNQNGYSVYDASSAQDTGGSSITAGPFTFFGGSTGSSTIYTDIAYITAEAPT